MAFQTPRHAVRLGVIDDRHVIDLAVATRAADPAIHMRRVIIKNVIGRAMKLHPLDRLARLPARPHRFELRIIFLHLRDGNSCRSACSARSSAPRLRQNCGNNGNPFPSCET